jgi:hypothetical protein
MTVLQRLSPRAELVLINLICFGPFAWISLRGLLRRETTLLFDDRRLYTIVAIELVCGALAILILRARGWKPADFGLQLSMPMIIAGFILYIVTTTIIAGLNLAFVTLAGSDPSTATTPIATASWPAVLLLLAIDPLYEETFEVAYNLRATARLGDRPFFGITLSAVIRLLCHAYQGPIASLTILPLGIIFALVYSKWRRVWPLAVAHGVAGWWALAPR